MLTLPSKVSKQTVVTHHGVSSTDLMQTIQTNLVKRITERSFSDTVDKKNDFKNNDASLALYYNMQLIST